MIDGEETKDQIVRGSTQDNQHHYKAHGEQKDVGGDTVDDTFLCPLLFDL